MEKKKINHYETANIAVNAVIFIIKDQKLWVYLSTREKAPFQNLLELPGGLLQPKETAEITLARKLKDITGVKNHFFQQFHTFTNPNRDPRSRIISIGFIALLAYDKVSNLKDFHQIDALPKLAFDHKEIIDRAIKYLKLNIDSQFVDQLMPNSFPLNDLQIVYEVIEGKKLDNRNFRKKILNSGLIQKAKIVQKNVNHRPASLYQFIKS